jgi:hypothetical protein
LGCSSLKIKLEIVVEAATTPVGAWQYPRSINEQAN